MLAQDVERKRTNVGADIENDWRLYSADHFERGSILLIQ